ncbi:MMPL family transporter [bacterium]|nr:MMPL family transporter [bacterium]
MPMVDTPAAANEPGLMSEVLRGMTHACARKPRTTLTIVAVVTLASIFITVTRLQFKTDRSDLIDPSVPFQQRWLKYTEDFGESSDMVVAIEASEPETIKATLDRLGQRLQAEHELFANVLYKIEPGGLRNKGLQYLPPDSLAIGLDRLEEYRPILNGRWDLIRLESLIPLLQFQLQDLRGEHTTGDALLWQHAERLSESLARFAKDRNDFVNPWPDILPIDPQLREQANQTVYMLNEQGTMGFLMAAPVKTKDSFEGATVAIDRLRHLIAETQSEFPDIKVWLTGIPVLENDEMRRSQQDSTQASLFSFVGVALLFFLGFRGLRHPALGMIVLAVGMAWSFGYTTLVIGHLNILSVAFASIVIGLGNDFAVHLLSRYLDLRHHGRDARHGIVEAAATIGPGIVTGAITTSLAFFCAAFTSFLGVAELGIIAGGGILLCTIATFTCLPALVALADRKSEERTLPVPFQGKILGRMTSEYPWAVIVGSLALFAATGWFGCDWKNGWPKPKLAYDHNLLHLQADGLESVEAQNRIFEASNNSLLYAVSLADSAEEARQMKARLEALPTVRHVEELATRLPAFPAQNSQLLVQGFRAHLSHLPQQPPPPAPANPGQVGHMLDSFYHFLQNTPGEPAKRVSRNLNQFLDELEKMNLQEQMTVLGEFQYRMSYALLAQFQALAQASDPTPVTVDDLPAELTARYVSPHGQWLLQVFPKDPVWDMEPLSQFVHDLRSVDPEVTGTPLQNYEAAQQIKQSYEVCAVYSLVVILLVLLLDFLPKELILATFAPPVFAVAAAIAILLVRDTPIPWISLLLAYAGSTFAIAAWKDRGCVIETVVGIVPPILGLLLTFGVLSSIGMSLNPANLIILPLIIGIGVDNGVHVLHDFYRRTTREYRPSPSLVNAISMTTSTSIVGFGSMMISAHRGLHSLGAVLSIGVASCVLLALVTLPAVLAIVARYRPPNASQSDDQSSLPPSDTETPADADDESPHILPMPKVPRVA